MLKGTTSKPSDAKMNRIVLASFKIVSLLCTAFLVGLAANIQPVRADYAWTETIYIRADGSVEPSAAPISTADNVTYALTDNIVGTVPAQSSAIVIERDNIVVNGAGYTLQGAAAGYAFDSKGIELTGRSNVTIKNMKITAFYYGILLSSSSKNTLSGNNISAPYALGNKYGVYLVSSSSNDVSGNIVTNNDYGVYLVSSSSNDVSGNIVTNNGDGVYLVSSSSSNVSGNNITDNNYYGVFLYSSSGNTLRSNAMTNNFYNFGVIGDHGNDVDESNTVNGKPIYYWIGVQDAIVPLDAGCVILVNCTRITVQDLTISHSSYGIRLVGTTNTTITRNSLTSNEYGILLSLSGNIVSENYVADNRVGITGGISNTVCRNEVANNMHYGIWLASSSNSTVCGNNVTNNAFIGIGLLLSSDSIIFENSVADNRHGIDLDRSSGSTIYHNSFINNSLQVSVSSSVAVWDDGYPSGGNYWSDYYGTDFYSGRYQNQIGYDLIGDTPYVIDNNNKDNYPLILPASTPQETLIAYRNLLAKYNELLTDFNNLSANYQQHLLNYSNLQGNYTSLQNSYDSLQANYTSLRSDHSDLQAGFDSLNSTYNDLRGDFDTLNLSHTNLNSSFNDYKTSMQGDFSYTRNLVYALAAVTVILIVAIVYPTIRKPKTKPETQ